MTASYFELCTTAQVKNWAIVTSDTDDAVIQSAITNFSRYVLTRTGRSYLGGFRSYSERVNGNGSTRLQLKNYPILSVSSLVIGTQTIPQSTNFVDAGWVIDTSGSQAAIALVGGQFGGWVGYGDAGQTPWRGSGYGNAPPLGQSPYLFWEGIGNVAISYVAGELKESFGEAATVPSNPGPYTVTAVNSTTFYADQGAMLANGNPLTGLYTVSTNGVYTFDASLAGQAVLLNYQYGGVPDDLNQMATELVAVNYKRRKWLDQVSQIQPGVGTTSYSRLEMPLECSAILDRYTRRFLDS